mmetsp:Transcript_5838/g.15009  ORF Transcript_5838/g.15009 Transcript_5838/m.15009 type:complete len:289 (+) Transcript_5838:81-947(+)
MRMSVSRSVPGTRCGTNGRADPSARSRSIRSDAASRDFRSRALQTAASRARRSTIPLRTGAVASGEWLDYLKFDGSTPDFDVVAKTIEYTSTPGYRAFQLREIPSEYYAEEYVFRGPVVGPINRKDLVETNACFGLDKSFPDLDRQTFGFCVDPDNPYRCLFFERWTATHTGDLSIPGVPGTLPATGRKANIPAFPFSVVWNPDGKIIYEHLTTAVDRFEGNTRGKVAVFGLFETAGVPLDNSVGNQALAFAQKVNRWLDGPAQIYSKQENIPKWWKSKAVGAEPNDM